MTFSQGGEFFLFCLRHFADDQIIGMVDQFKDQRFRQIAIDDERVPVFFVHVITGDDGFILFAQGQGVIGIAL